MKFDVELAASRVQELSNPDALAGFFASLGYNVEGRIEQTPTNLGIDTDSLKKAIKRSERIADQEGLFQIYLFEVTSVTVALTRALARSFRKFGGEYLLVLTSDWDRIDFVFLDKFVPKVSPKAVTPPQVGIRPRSLTVQRRNPSTVHLRVLRRFTYTESDPFSQFDKLRSAYAIADWSEDFFNNRALFSDYFLSSKERFRSWEAWKEDAKPAFKSLFDIYRDAASTFAGQKEAVIRNGLLEPTLKALGFQLEACKPGQCEEDHPDYYLRSNKAPGENIAACLTYPWSRSLDGKDSERDTETHEENPGAVVVSLLEKNLAPWAIVTNGRTWRLYSQQTHSRATNYYEIDLEEVLSQTGPKSETIAESFRYFWLLFRVQAFEPIIEERDGKEHKTSFLNRLLVESEGYAKELGERLKERVFEEIFPHLGEGFVEFIKQEEGKDFEIDQDRLDAIFQGVLTLLYRLLFLLFAESRDLLPVRETRGYFQKSLTALKTRIAESAGAIGDQVAASLKSAYRIDEYSLYDQITDLCRIVDLGDSNLNVPLYNGGLFITEPGDDDRTIEARNARFLKDHKVPDRYLSLAIDLLARDLDPKRQDLVFIDFKSLGVRQLGSIYEGLLEFKLRIAPEKMALVKGKKSDLVVPYREAKKDAKMKILADGRGQNARERTLSKGTVYLENDKRERKATGSYYTPDHIVEYIVANAVGPVLEEKFEKMRPKLREAQKDRKAFFDKQDALQKAGIKSEPKEKADLIGRDLVDELFDIKVLDKAMGSGHFLVETVDFITDKAIDFLNGFPWNPVFAHLERMRQTILKEMDEQSITIDPARLTDVNLLKRHILKKCIYGVDLNPMAVELAKVSLWLDCFTLGAPLSFLDHHLKCGNSLIGVNVQEVRDAVEGKAGEASQQMLFGSQFAGLMLATDLMRHVGELSDVTSEQVKQSRTEFRKASDALAPFKRILDVYTTQWFGNTPYKHKVGKTVTVLNPAVSFLKDRESEQWIKKPHDLESLSNHGLEIASIALAASEEKRFFHWELEFPEVFYGPRPGTTQAIERLPGAGFDAVVGNPPWGALESAEEQIFYRTKYESAHCRSIDSYALLTERSLAYLRRGGFLGFITPDTFLRKEDRLLVRKPLLENYQIVELTETGPMFSEVRDTWCLVFIVINKKPDEFNQIRQRQISRFIVSAEERLQLFSQQSWDRDSLVTQAAWRKPPDFTIGYLASNAEQELISKIETFPRLGDSEGDILISRGEEGSKFTQNVTDKDGYYMIIPEHVEMLRVEQGLKVPRKSFSPQKLSDYYAHPKLWIIRIQKLRWKQRLVCGYDPRTNSGAMKTLQVLVSSTDDTKVLLYLWAVLNSRLINFWCTNYLADDMNKSYLQRIPIPPNWEKKKAMHNLPQNIVEKALMLNCGSVSKNTQSDQIRIEIDHLVYQLYGFTDEEILVVEGVG